MSSQSKKTASDSGASESESESEEEETKSRIPATKQQQEAPKQQEQKVEEEEEEDDDEEEEEEESETDSDDEADARYDTVKRDVYAAGAGAGAGGAPAKVPDVYPVGKRGRDLNGGKGTEPASKKRKEAKDEKSRVQQQQPVKSASPVKGVKGLRTTTAVPKVDKAGGAKAVAVGKGENAKPQAASRKRKASPPPVNSSRQQLRKGGQDERSSPLKAKKTAHWSGNLEQSLAAILYKDKCNGFPIPVSRGDPYWEKLLKRLPLEVEMTELQVVDKVKRMRNRYHTLEKKFKEEGGRGGEGGKTHFKNAHEEKLFQIWEGIWGQATEPTVGRTAVTSQPATDEEDSEDESEGTASPPGEAVRVIRGQQQLKREESSSEDENEEEEEDVKRKGAGLNVMNAAGRPRTEQVVVTPFVSKPRLEFTPLNPKDDKRKASKKNEEVTSGGDQHTGDVLAGDDGRRVDVNFVTTEHLKQLRAETLTFFQEIRGNCFQLVEEIRGDRFGSLAGGVGNFGFGKGVGHPGMLDGLVTGSGSQAALQLQKRWREHKVQELALLSERLQLLQEQCRLQQDELKLQNQKLEQQERSK